METSEELIAEARKLIAHCKTYNFGLYGADRLAHEIAPRLVDALEAATTEPEWEYQWGDPAGIRDDTFNGFDHYETFEEAKVEMDQDNDYPYSRVVRRRKAGSCLPVEGESV